MTSARRSSGAFHHANSPEKSSKQARLMFAEGDSMVMNDSRVAVVGSGLIGRAWAMVFAGAGCHVALYDSVAGGAAKARALAPQGREGLAGQASAGAPNS